YVGQLPDARQFAQALTSLGIPLPEVSLEDREFGGTAAALSPAISPYAAIPGKIRSEEHTSELQSRFDLVCRLLLEKKKQQHRYDCRRLIERFCEHRLLQIFQPQVFLEVGVNLL